MAKVALVHDYLREYGGAERVLEELHRLYPEAPVYTAFVDQKSLGENWQRFQDWDIRQTFLSKIPLIKKTFSPLRVLAARAFAQLDLSEFDIVISSSNAYMAKAARASKPHAKHFCYCHTPSRVLYGYTAKSHWRDRAITRFFGEIINHYMRFVDFRVAQEVGVFIANSEETQARIKKFYHRDSSVVYPPVDTSFYNPREEEIVKKNYFLFVGRFVPYKKADLVIEAFYKLGIELRIIGTGPEEHKLKKIAKDNVKFLGRASDKVLFENLKSAKAVIFPSEEDFGIVPVEAMACGTPVISYGVGGATETVISGKTGEYFFEQTPSSLIEVVKKFDSKKYKFSDLRSRAEEFSLEKFRENFRKQIDEYYADYKKKFEL